MKRPLQIALAIALAAGSIDALALGLGTIEVKSRLNEPLVAEIPVIQASPGEAQGLIVQLASSEDFERVGLSRTRVGIPLEFSLHSSGDRTVIRVTTQDVVREPFLDFLVEANWPNGRLLREYTVLLDPPVMAPSRSAQTRTPEPAARVDEPAPVARTEPEPAPTPAATPDAPREPAVVQAPPPPAPAAPAPAAESKPPPAPAPSSEPAPASPQVTADGEFGPVDAGQTLSEIARVTRADDSVSINQMMIALLRHNPDAFYQDNINALKRGAILRIPSAEEVRATAAEQEAAQLARAQIDEWRTAASPTLITDAAPAPAPVTTGKRESAAAEPATQRERVALVPPRSGDEGTEGGAVARRGGDGASDAQLRNELARVAEDLETKRQEAAELRSRLSDLEDTNAKSTRMIALQNDQLAQLQAQLEQLRESGAAADLPGTAAALADHQLLADVDSDVDGGSTEDFAEAADTTEVMADADAVAADEVSADDGDEAAVAAVDSDAAADIWGNGDLVDDVTDAASEDDSALVMEGDAIMADVGDSPAGAASEAEILPLDAAVREPGIVDDAVAPTPAGTQSSTGAVSPATPWYQRPIVLGLGALALLLAALGLRSRRGAKAEPKPRRKSVADQFSESEHTDDVTRAVHDDEIVALRSQLAENESDAGLHLELASLYYSLADREAFIAAARDMHAHVDSGSDEWAAVRSMGQELAGDEPLFADLGAPDTEVAALETTEDFSPDLAPVADGETDPSLDYDALLGDLQADAPLDEPAADSLVFDARDDDGQDDFGIAPRSDGADVEPDAASSFLDSMDGGQEHDAGLDFSSADAATPPSTEPLVDEAEGLSFDLDDTADAARGDDLDPLDFDMQTAGDGEASMQDMGDGTASLDPLATDALSLDDELGSLTDLPGVDAGLDDDGGPTGIKLDLAKAYLDMGDPDGAKAMLEEVLTEGTEAQQEDARALIERIG